MTLTLLPRLMPLKAKVIATLNKQGKKERRKEGRKHLLPPLPSLLPSVFHHHRHHVTGWPRWLEKNILWVLSYPYIFHWNNTQVKRVHIVFYDQVWRDCRHGRLGKHLSQARASVLSWLRSWGTAVTNTHNMHPKGCKFIWAYMHPSRYYSDVGPRQVDQGVAL